MNESPFAQAVAAYVALEQLTKPSADVAARRGQALDFAREHARRRGEVPEDDMGEYMLDRVQEEGYDDLDEEVLVNLIQQALRETRAERTVNHAEMRRVDASRWAVYNASFLASKEPDDRLRYMRVEEGFSDLDEAMLTGLINRAISLRSASW